MTNAEIIALARQAGAPDTSCNPEGELMPWVVAFAELVAAAERDACAKVCDDIRSRYNEFEDAPYRITAEWCAEEIRARSDK